MKHYKSKIPFFAEASETFNINKKADLSLDYETNAQTDLIKQFQIITLAYPNESMADRMQRLMADTNQTEDELTLQNTI